MKTVLVTGANGFIGSILCKNLLAASAFEVKAAVRHQPDPANPATEVQINNINSQTPWHDALQNVDVIVHLAARVHIMEETVNNPNNLFFDVNLHGTKNLARQAADAGVKRFIYISTIKVNGEGSGKVLCAEAKATPADAYAESKWAAEQALAQIAEDTGLEVIIIRPPLVYGPGVKGNFLRLLKLVARGLPIPLGAVSNKRSMVYVDNLCDLIKTCITHPKAPGQVFLVSDNEDLSTPELIALLAVSLKHSEKLIAIPVAWLSRLGKLFGKEAEIHRLCSSLRVDISKTTELLDWQPPYSVQQGVQETVNWFLANK